MAMISKRVALHLLGAAAIALPILTSAAHAAFPERSIKLVVPYTPGGQFDFHARLVAERMTDILKQPVIVENKPGAATMLGAELVKNSPNDGYTLLWAGANMLSVLPNLYSKMAYKVSDFQTVTLVSDLPMSLVIDSKQMPGVNNVKEWVEFIKARPGKIDYAAIGRGGAQHLMAQLASLRFGLEMNPIIYRGTPEVVTALLSGQVSMTFDGALAYLPHVGTDKQLRMLAVTGPKRIEVAPNVPTFAELGHTNMVATTYGGIIVPAGTPKDVVDTLRNAIVQANSDPKVMAAVVKSGGTPRTSTPEEFDNVIQSYAKTWAEVIKAFNIKLD